MFLHLWLRSRNDILRHLGLLFSSVCSCCVASTSEQRCMIIIALCALLTTGTRRTATSPARICTSSTSTGWRPSGSATSWKTWWAKSRARSSRTAMTPSYRPVARCPSRPPSTGRPSTPPFRSWCGLASIATRCPVPHPRPIATTSAARCRRRRPSLRSPAATKTIIAATSRSSRTDTETSRITPTSRNPNASATTSTSPSNTFSTGTDSYKYPSPNQAD